MDEVDAAHAQIARNMLDSGDWVTPHLNGVIYLEKAPLHFWIIAVSYLIFGVHDWAARIPLALSAIALCWVTARFGAWAFSPRAGLYAGLSLATSVGLFLFTRVLIPDAILTLAVAVVMWSLLRALDDDESRPRLWATLLAASIGVGLLLKGLIAAVLPAGAGLIYLLITRQAFSRRTWRRLHPLSGLLIVMLIAAPWYVLATLRNPPYFDFTLKSDPGRYRGFFWFYFFNEHLLRYLNLRYPRDYDTVPRLWFWLSHLVWLFPWSVYFPAVARLSFKPSDRAGRTRLLALCWTGFLLVFFSFSTTQEYYSLPCYPALALLLGSAIAAGGNLIRGGTKLAGALAGAAAMMTAVMLFSVSGLAASGDISSALTQNTDAYALSLGHMADLTLPWFAYLRWPLALAGISLLLGSLGALRLSVTRAVFALAFMMFGLAHAARLALVTFDPYLSSRPLAETLLREPEGKVIVDGEYYAFSSLFFYTHGRGLLLNGRFNNLEYGSYAPGAPRVFINDSEFQRLWHSPERYYLLATNSAVPRLEKLVSNTALHVSTQSAGKILFTNQEPNSQPSRMLTLRQERPTP